jgi:hypothetical protein
VLTLVPVNVVSFGRDLLRNFFDLNASFKQVKFLLCAMLYVNDDGLRK